METVGDQYMANEVVGTRIRHWEHPVHDFLMPYARGAAQRVLGNTIIDEDTQLRGI